MRYSHGFLLLVFTELLLISQLKVTFLCYRSKIALFYGQLSMIKLHELHPVYNAVLHIQDSLHFMPVKHNTISFTISLSFCSNPFSEKNDPPMGLRSFHNNNMLCVVCGFQDQRRSTVIVGNNSPWRQTKTVFKFQREKLQNTHQRIKLNEKY